MPAARKIQAFRKTFSTDRACLEYLAHCRWPEGFVCPKCSSREATLLKTRFVYQCRKCRTQVSPTAGTVMHRSHIPIQEWFLAAFLLAGHEPGISAVELQRQLGIGSYKNAWNLLRRLRCAMISDSLPKLSGTVRVYVTSVGESRKCRIIGAIEVITDELGERAGRLRLASLPNTDPRTIHAFLVKSIEKGSRIRTNGQLTLTPQALALFKHKVRSISPGEDAEKRFPHIHRAFREVKSWLKRTHRGVAPVHMQGYLDEFTFRFNHAASHERGFQTLLGVSARTAPASLSQRDRLFL